MLPEAMLATAALVVAVAGPVPVVVAAVLDAVLPLAVVTVAVEAT